MSIRLFYLVVIIISLNYQQAKTHPLAHDPSECRIIFYENQNYQGANVETVETEGISNLQMNEESAQTYGRCCWKIYKYVIIKSFQ